MAGGGLDLAELVENFADEVKEMEWAFGYGLDSGMMGIFYR